MLAYAIIPRVVNIANSFSEVNGVRFPEERLHSINRTYDLGGGRKPRKANDGKGGYHVIIDVFHQLHCLVSLDR
jgi:hypothetical protein